MNNQSKLTVSYLRIASRSQRDGGLGVEVQRRACEQIAGRIGVRIARSYLDIGVSGLSRKRPALSRLMRDLARGEIEHVLVANPTRLARSWQLDREIRQQIHRHGATVTDTETL